MPMSWPICCKRINEIVGLACAARLLPRGIAPGGTVAAISASRRGTQFADSFVFN